MRSDALTMTLLFDYYGDLLTEKQRLCFDLHYNEDLSLGEIADEAGITRQGVHDTLARAEAALENFEQKTGCVARAAETRAALQEIRGAAEALRALPGAAEQAERILSAAERIKE
jgi:predicted DNA-binding protein YlxM (UPF0122 family)